MLNDCKVAYDRTRLAIKEYNFTTFLLLGQFNLFSMKLLNDFSLYRLYRFGKLQRELT